MRFSIVPAVFAQSPSGYLLDVAPAAGATVPPSSSSSGDSSTAGSPSITPPTGSSASPTSSGAAPAAPVAGAPPASATARPADGGWVPPTREQWENAERARRTAITRAATTDRDLKAERARVAALAGVTPVKPEDAQKAEVAEAFFQLFPQFAMFKDPAIGERLAGLLAKSDELSTASDHVWDGLTRRTLDTLQSKFAEATGVDVSELTDRDRRELAALFFQMSQDDPEGFTKRYEREDPKLVDEFMARMDTRYFAPVRRRAAAGIVRGQPRVPMSGPGRPVVSAPPQIDFGDRDAVENAAVTYLKEHGHLTEA